MSNSINAVLKTNSVYTFVVDGVSIRLYIFRSGRFFFYLSGEQSVTHGTYSYESSCKRYNLRSFVSENFTIILDNDTLEFSVNTKVKHCGLKYTVTHFDDANYEAVFIEIPQGVLDAFHKGSVNLPCCAPLTNMNISSDGNVGLCNANSEYIFGKWPNQTLKSIWFSEKRKLAARRVLENKLDASCLCHNFINKRYITGSNPINGYDNAYDILKSYICDIDNNMPINMRFQLGIKCNMTCIMCGEHASSLHRENLNLPVFVPPFQLQREQFLSELSEFIPKLQRIVFTGGESLMQPIYYDIFKLMIDAKWDGMKVYIFSNGSVYNKKVEEYLKFFGRKVQLNLSIDSFNRDIYSSIREGGDYNTMLKNLFKFKAIDCDLRLSVTALKQNAVDILNSLQFCDKHSIRMGIYPAFTNHSFYNGEKTESTAIFDWDMAKLETLLETYNEFDKYYYKERKLDSVMKENKSFLKKLMLDVSSHIDRIKTPQQAIVLS